MNSVMKKSLAAPIRQFTSCVSGSEDTKRDGSKKTQTVRRKSVVWRDSIFRRKSVVRRKSAPCTSQKVPDSWLRVYQADLQRERKLREARFAKKNAERAVGRTYFRSQHCLRRTSNARRPAGKTADNSLFGAFQREHCLRSTSNARRPAGKTADSSLFGAFQGLSLDGLTGGNQASMAFSGDQCTVM